VTVAAWYDNEWGFTSRLVETAALLVKQAEPTP
jgi:glyceraldehyde-3-phosphate dehydrogenase/erythrose-4-phosphate dehydrogenase